MKAAKLNLNYMAFVFPEDTEQAEATVEAIATQIRVEAAIQGLTGLQTEEW